MVFLSSSQNKAEYISNIPLSPALLDQECIPAHASGSAFPKAAEEDKTLVSVSPHRSGSYTEGQVQQDDSLSSSYPIKQK